MFRLFKKKTPEQILQLRYEKLMQEVYTLSKTNRKASDEKYAEAEKVLLQIEELRKQE